MKPSGQNDPKPQQTNTVRISAVDLMKLDQEMNLKKSGHNTRRAFIRWPFAKQSLAVEMHQPGGVGSTLRYACRNLSTTGMGILHSSYVHSGTRCVVHLPGLEGNIHPTPAKVMRCIHYKGIIHEVGIGFDAPLNIRDFVQLDPLDGLFTMEHVSPDRLSGSVLHVDDSSLDRRLVRHYLKDTNLNVVTADNGEQALARSGEGFDIVLCENDLPDMTGVKFIESMRAKGLQMPIIVTTSDGRVTSRNEAREARASAYICKPFTQDQILRALAEFMLMEASDTDSGGPVYSLLTPADSAFTFVPEFIEELRGTADKVNAALAKNDVVVLKRLCSQVRGSAKGLGFAIVGSAAESAVSALERGKVPADWSRAVRTLVGLAMRVRVREPDRKAG